MNLYSREGNRFQRIQNRNAGVGIGPRVNHNGIRVSIGPLDLIYQVPLMVGLILGHFRTGFFSGCLQQGQQIREAVLSIDPRFPNAQHIQIGAVDNQYFHIRSSHAVMICARVSSRPPLLSTV